MSLNQSSCEPCKSGAPQLTDAQIAELQPQVPQWKVAEVGGVRRIQRTFEFEDFQSAMDFAVAVGQLAEREGHHPDLHVSWGKVMVETWTHKIQGLHQNDFILAAKTDEIYELQKARAGAGE
jgi:4a-hydroxytetrahydrobiopterin dehydratase